MSAETAPPADFTPAGFKGRMRRQEQPEGSSVDLAALIAAAAGDELLRELLGRAWSLGWHAGWADAEGRSSGTACPFGLDGGWLDPPAPEISQREAEAIADVMLVDAELRGYPVPDGAR